MRYPLLYSLFDISRFFSHRHLICVLSAPCISLILSNMDLRKQMLFKEAAAMHPQTNHTIQANPSKTHIEFFAGIGGVTAGLKSWSTIWANDIEL